MKGCLLAGAAILSMCSHALAADFYVPIVDPPPNYDWSGTYIGAHIGYGRGTANVVDGEYNGGFHPLFPVVRFGMGADGLFGGLSLGHNWVRDHFVLGIEGEVGYLGLEARQFPPFNDPFGAPYDASAAVSGGWYAGLSGRLGYAVDNTLFYGKGGVVFSTAELGYDDVCDAGPICGPGTLNASGALGLGYQIGAGIEHALTEKWTLKAEYSYFDFGTTNVTGVVSGGGFHGRTMNIQSSLATHALRLGLNYQF